ncbi:MAG: hypothetical protein M1826_002691 [Phylliscum demangeonii]|nr:MAG: hypothetical protein M1826_002691 [Phylliscum demangeonii]
MPRRREVVEVQEPEQLGASSALRSAIQGVLIFIAIQLFIRQFMSGKQATTAVRDATVPAFDERLHPVEAQSTYNVVPQEISPIWPLGTPLDISLYVAASLSMPALKTVPSERLIAQEKAFKIGDYSDKREIHTTFAVPKESQYNGTIWGHFYVAVSGHVLDPLEKGYDPSKAYHFVRPLSHYLVKKKVVRAKKLLGGSNGTEKADGASRSSSADGPTIAAYYHSNFTVSVIPDSGVLAFPSMHPATRQYVQLESTGARDASGQNAWYYPILFLNTFWQLRDHMTELNSTVTRLPLHMSLNNLNNWKFGIYASLDEGIKQTQRQAATGGSLGAGGDGSELEIVKRILVDTNIYLLATTGVVSILHMIFEMLAFKSDISHWKNKKDNVGVSVRTIIANVIMQAIILLYLFDNSDGTSWVILGGQGFSILLEAWKITKTVDVRIRPAPAGSSLPYHITFEDKHKLSETEKKTKEYDEIAFKYLYMIAVPLLLAYAAYSLVYETHKSWYSFIITALVGSVYAYGFLMMVPSLYINYRLKSVAHMPRKAMMYKFLNTFIDDLFAWTIKMPTLHRLATLRDDVVFFVYLWQAYKYRTDYTRINEFGQGGGDDDDKANDAGAKKPGAALHPAVVDPARLAKPALAEAEQPSPRPSSSSLSSSLAAVTAAVADTAAAAAGATAATAATTSGREKVVVADAVADADADGGDAHGSGLVKRR